MPFATILKGFIVQQNGQQQSRKKLITERPIGTIFEILEEPEPGFVDVEGEADKEACRWERDGCESETTVRRSKSI